MVKTDAPSAKLLSSSSAIAALLFGTLIYVLDRDWASTLFLAPLASYQFFSGGYFGVLGGSLPALLHAYAISLLVIICLWAWPRAWPWLCLLWFGIAMCLEVLQLQVASLWIAANGHLLDVIPGGHHLKAYSAHGQFHVLDILATGAGCLSALTVAIAIKRWQLSD